MEKLNKERTFGVRKGRRVPGETGIDREKGEEFMIYHVGDM